MNTRMTLLLGLLALSIGAAALDVFLPPEDETLVVSVAPRVRTASPEPASAGLSGGVAPAVNPLAGLPVEAFAAIVERPLFMPSRRPAPSAAPVEAVAGSAAVVDSDYVLEGVVVSPSGQVAVLRRASDGERLRLRPGEVIDGWSVSAVSARAVVLEKDGARKDLALALTAGPGVTAPNGVVDTGPPPGASELPSLPKPEWLAPVEEKQ